jgi:hypothetical protein
MIREQPTKNAPQGCWRRMSQRRSASLEMPQRTNDYQQLIALLHHQLAPEGATVTESHMVHLKGKLREVDVVIRAEVAGIPINIFVECRDRGRPADIEWIDQLVGKYRDSGGKVVAVSRSGFTEAALQAAKTAGITVMSIAEATDTNWAEWVRNIDRIWFTFVHRWLERVVSIGLAASEARPPDAAVRLSEVVFERSDGSPLGTVFDIFTRQRGAPGFDESVTRAPHQPDGKIKFTLGLPAAAVAVTPDGEKRLATGIVYLLGEEVDTVEVPLSPGEYAARSVAMGVGTGAMWKAQVVYVQGEDGKTRTSIRIARLDGQKFVDGHVEFYGVGWPIPGYTSS